MRAKPFVRTLEFLWQEGYTAHATPEEAEKEINSFCSKRCSHSSNSLHFHLINSSTELQPLQMIGVYIKFAYEEAAIPVIAGRKSKMETFAGASKTYTIDAMMGNRKALLTRMSHNLGQNFSHAFGTQFTDENGQRQHVWQT